MIKFSLKIKIVFNLWHLYSAYYNIFALVCQKHKLNNRNDLKNSILKIKDGFSIKSTKKNFPEINYRITSKSVPKLASQKR